METRIGEAFHEAGHAVALWRQGLEIKYVTINNPFIDDPKKKCWTQPQLEKLPPNEPDLADKLCIFINAGCDAEEIKLGEVPELRLMEHQERIQGYLELSGRNFTDEEERHHVRKLSEEAYNLISESWELVEIVANELLEKDTLTGEKADTLLRKL